MARLGGPGQARYAGRWRWRWSWSRASARLLRLSASLRRPGVVVGPRAAFLEIRGGEGGEGAGLTVFPRGVSFGCSRVGGRKEEALC